MLDSEYETAINITTADEGLLIIAAIKNIKIRLGYYNKIPPNGLAVFCGNFYVKEDDKERKISIDFEPFKPINKYIYLCDICFHTELLEELLN